MTTSHETHHPRLQVAWTELKAEPQWDLPYLLTQLSDSNDALVWSDQEKTIIGWGRAFEEEYSGRYAIREAASHWDSICHSATVTQFVAGENDTFHLHPDNSKHSYFSPNGPGDRVVSFPTAFASFGFAWKTPGYIIVPRYTFILTQGRAFISSASLGNNAPGLDEFYARLKGASPSPIRTPAGLVTAPGRMSQRSWTDAVRRLVKRLRSGGASKVVIARDMVVTSGNPIDERFVLNRLHELYPSTWVYAVAGLVGATPEMLARSKRGVLTSRVLAGTSKPGRGQELLDDIKERTEHLLAVESVARALDPLSRDLKVPEEPFLLDLPNVTHLASDIHARLVDGNVLHAVAALHPTAAVCGTPTSLAFDLLTVFEETARGRYSGPVGWIDSEGDGEFGLGLRCAQLEEGGKQLRVYAGAGIMPDSVPEAELAETRAKMRPVLDALGIDS